MMHMLHIMAGYAGRMSKLAGNAGWLWLLCWILLVGYAGIAMC
jgi:hypothetical protein